VNQLLDQRYQLQKNISLLNDNSDIKDVAVHGVVIARRTPDAKPKLKSLKLFRNALKSVTIVTFDELLIKLEHLLGTTYVPAEVRSRTHRLCQGQSWQDQHGVGRATRRLAMMK